MADHKNTSHESSHGSSHEFKKLKPQTFKERFDDNEDKKHFPSFHLDSDMLPEIKDWPNRVTYEVTLKIRQENRRDEQSGRVSSDFDIIAIKSEGKSVTPEQKKAMEDMGV